MRGIDPRTEAIGAVGGEQEKVSALRMVRVLVAGEDKMRNGCGSRPAIVRDFPAELAGWGQVPALGEGRLSDRQKLNGPAGGRQWEGIAAFVLFQRSRWSEMSGMLQISSFWPADGRRKRLEEGGIVLCCVVG